MSDAGARAESDAVREEGAEAEPAAPARSASGRPLHHDRRLVVVRHGITADNAAGIWQGHKDTPLSETGVAQAQAAAAALTAYRPAVVLSSDLARAAETAAAIARSCGLEVRHDPRLREIHVGNWQGLRNADVVARHPEVADAIARGEDLRRGETGETVAEVTQRALAAVHDLLAELPSDATAFVVTHGVSARALVAALTGIEQRTAWLSLSGLGNCHWAELREYDDRWRLYAWNHAAPEPAAVPADGRASAY